MRSFLTWIFGLMLPILPNMGTAQTMPDDTSSTPTTIYAAKVQPMAADKMVPNSLDPYRGTVMLIVNVASKCGHTKQYTGLEALHRKYKDQGFTVLGFPCNQFKNQEPGTEEEIVAFCKANYDVSFPIYGKIDVNGPGRAPLYKYLVANAGSGSGDVKWNFEKFLVGRDGKVIARYISRTTPEDPELVAAIEKALAEPAPATK